MPVWLLLRYGRLATTYLLFGADHQAVRTWLATGAALPDGHEPP